MADPGKPQKRRTPVSQDRDVKIRLSADTKDAIRAVKELERQVNKISDFADQGEKRQRGFLSSNQVRVYKSILREMEASYKHHQERISQLESSYQKKRTGILDSISKRDKEILRLKTSGAGTVMIGNNQFGTPSDKSKTLDGVIQVHQTKKEQAISQLEDLDKLNLPNIEAAKKALSDLDDQMGRAEGPRRRIGKMHESDPRERSAFNASVSMLLNSAILSSIGQLVSYTKVGIDKRREQNFLGMSLGQSMTSIYQGDDEKVRQDALDIGKYNQWNAAETLHTQRILAQGGVSNREGLAQDTYAVQSLGRAMAIDPNSLASQTNMLRKMGALDEGQMVRFANLIGGAVAKNDMNGREEEMIRSTVSLVQSVGNNLAKMDERQMNSVIGTQVALGESVSTLRGERGAELLSQMDSSIKNSSQPLDIIMGLGRRPEYSGLQGVMNLRYQQEEGLANPQNLQDIFKGLKEMSGGNQLIEDAMAQTAGLNLHQYRSLRESGFVDRVRKGEFNVSDQEIEAVRGIGGDELVKRLQAYQNSQTYKVLDNRTKNNETQTTLAHPFEHLGTGASNLYNRMPAWMRAAGIVGGVGLLTAKGGAIRRYGYEAYKKTLGTNVDGEGGLKSIWEGLFSKGTPGTPGPTPSTPTPIAPNPNIPSVANSKPVVSTPAAPLASSADDLTKVSLKGGVFSAMGQSGKRITEGMSKYGDDLTRAGAQGAGELLENAGTALTGTSKVLGALGKRVPVASILLGTALDKAFNPNNSWGRSLTKSVFGTIGGGLGLTGAGLMGLGSGGAGLLAAGGMTIAGSMAGEKVGDTVYSALFGDKDKRGVQPLGKLETTPIYHNEVKQLQTQAVQSMSVATMTIQDKSFDTFLQKIEELAKERKASGEPSPVVRGFSAVDQALRMAQPEQVIRVIIEGKVEGMTDENQGKVATSIITRIGSLFPKRDSGYDFSFAQNRE